MTKKENNVGLINKESDEDSNDQSVCQSDAQTTSQPDSQPVENSQNIHDEMAAVQKKPAKNKVNKHFTGKVKKTQAGHFSSDELTKTFTMARNTNPLMIKNKLSEKVKTAKGRKTSSTRWLSRQLNDPYVQLAKEKNYRGRAAFKFIEIDEKYNLLQNANNILDLGCAPGAWSQYCSRKLEKNEDAKIIAIDLLEVVEINEGVKIDILQGDFTAAEMQEQIIKLLNKKATKFDLILSDMAPSATGNKTADHLQNEFLVDKVIDFSLDHLGKGGSFLCKTFHGATTKEQSEILKNHFKIVKHVKPKSSRAKSAEFFLMAKGFQL